MIRLVLALIGIAILGGAVGGMVAGFMLGMFG